MTEQVESKSKEAESEEQPPKNNEDLNENRVSDIADRHCRNLQCPMMDNAETDDCTKTLAHFFYYPCTFQTRMSHASRPPQPNFIGWLTNVVKLPQYETNLQSNGYNNLEFVQHIKSQQQLSEIGISKPGHQLQILHSIKKLQTPQPPLPSIIFTIKYITTTIVSTNITIDTTNIKFYHKYIRFTTNNKYEWFNTKFNNK